jgi:type I restriction enzyme S subunit
MMQGWEIKTLEEACEMYQPKTISKKEMTDDGEYTVFGANGVIGKYDKYNHEEPQLLITCRGATCGSVNISTPKSWINGNAMVVRPKDNSIDLKFLEYMFRGGIDLSETISGAAQPQITRQSLNPVQIAYPKCLPEQQQIVSILDHAFAAIDKAKANAKQNLKNAKELFESYLQGVFEKKGDGWEEKRLREIFDIGSSKRIMEKDWTSDGVPFYGGKEIVKLAKFGFAVSNSYISEEKYDEYASKYDMPQHGDILITARGTIGVGYIVKNDDKFYYKDGNIISMRAKIPANPEFILYAFKTSAINDQIRKLTGATVSHLPINKAKNLVMMIPNFSTQNIVVEKIQQMEAETRKLEMAYQKKMADLEELKKSILQKAFTGELETEKVEIV